MSLLCPLIYWMIGWFMWSFFYAHVFGILEPCPSCIPLQGWNQCSAAESPHQGSGCAASQWTAGKIVPLAVFVGQVDSKFLRSKCTCWTLGKLCRCHMLQYQMSSYVIISCHMSSCVIICHHILPYIYTWQEGFWKLWFSIFYGGEHCLTSNVTAPGVDLRLQSIDSAGNGVKSQQPLRVVSSHGWYPQNHQSSSHFDRNKMGKWFKVWRDLGITYNYNYKLNLYNTTYVCNIYIYIHYRAMFWDPFQSSDQVDTDFRPVEVEAGACRVFWWPAAL